MTKRQNQPETQGGDTIADYIMADTPLPIYLPYPRFLLKMEISQTAKLLYSLLLDRSTPVSYTHLLVTPIFRAYEYYLHRILGDIMGLDTETDKGANNFSFFTKNAAGLYLSLIHIYCKNRYGELCPQQEKALEELGFELPDPSKPKGKHNNRKQTFDAVCRTLLRCV